MGRRRRRRPPGRRRVRRARRAACSTRARRSSPRPARTGTPKRRRRAPWSSRARSSPKRIPRSSPRARRASPVRSEIDLAADRARVPIVAVTGTNGKTTVTSLTAAMLEASGRRATAAGNIGRTAPRRGRRRRRRPRRRGVLVPARVRGDVPASGRGAPRPRRRPSRLARHVRQLRRREGARSSSTSATTTCSCSTATTRSRRRPRRARRRGASRSRCAQSSDAFHVAGDALCTPDGHVFASVADMRRALPHDRTNALAAAAAAFEVGATEPGVRDALARYETMPHRVALVGEHGGVQFVDDSKATNPHATVHAVAAFDSVVLLAGGRNKGLDLAALAACGGSDPGRRRVRRSRDRGARRVRGRPARGDRRLDARRRRSRRRFRRRPATWSCCHRRARRSTRTRTTARAATTSRRRCAPTSRAGCRPTRKQTHGDRDHAAHRDRSDQSAHDTHPRRPHARARRVPAAADLRRAVRDHRRAQRDRARDDPVGVLGRGAEQLRLLVVLLQPAARVGAVRRARLRHRGAYRLPRLAPHRAVRAHGHRRAAGRGARAGHRDRRRRLAALARYRAAARAAERDREDRAAAVRRRRARAPRRLARRLARVEPGARRRWGAVRPA